MGKTSKLLLLIFCAGRGLLAQDLPSGLRDVENVSLDSSQHSVFYEQRLYRNPLEGLLLARRVCGDEGACSLMPMVQGIPVGAYGLDSSVSYRPLSSAERKSYRLRSRFSPFKYLFDFRIQPEFEAIFGNPSQTVQGRFSLILQYQMYLWPGMALNLGVLFPVANSLDTRPGKVCPGPLHLNQFVALGNHNFLSLSAGTFQYDRYGFGAQFQRMNLSGAWSYGLEASLTGLYYFPKGGVYHTPLSERLLLGNVAYRLKQLNSVAKLTAGRYAAGDWGTRLDMIRQFNSVEIALFAVKTQNGATIGFNLAMPVPPGKILRAGQARLRTSEEFRLEYAYAGFDIGTRYRLGYHLDERLRQYHRDYLNNQVKRLRGKE